MRGEEVVSASRMRGEEVSASTVARRALSEYKEAPRRKCGYYQRNCSDWMA